MPFARSNKTSLFLWLLPVSILLAGLLTHLVMYVVDRWDFDTYFMMMGVDKSLLEYHRAIPYWFPIIVHSWVFHRIFEYSVAGFLLMSFLTAALTMLLVFIAVKRHWDSPLLCAVALFVVAFNGHFLFLTQYNYVYMNTFFVSACLYFLFLELSTGRLEKKYWFWIAVASIPMAFFSLYLLLVPLATGFFSVIVFRTLKWPEHRNLKAIWRSTLEMSPLLIFPVTYYVVNSIFPLAYITPEKRADFAPWFLYSSKYSKDLLGVIKFSVDNTALIISQLLPRTGILTEFLPSLETVVALLPKELIIIIKCCLRIAAYIAVPVLALFAVLLIKVMFSLRRAGHFAFLRDPKMHFTLFFFVVTYAGILAGGLLGVYPFGTIRYSTFLLVPAAILAGWLFSPLGKLLGWKTTIVMAALIIISGSAYNVVRFSSNHSIEMENIQAIEKIKSADADLVLFSAYQRPILYAKARDKYEKGIEMGWGTYFGKGEDGGVPGAIFSRITGENSHISVNKVLVVANGSDFFEREYPSWAGLLNEFFARKKNITAPGIWGALYERKDPKAMEGTADNIKQRTQRFLGDKKSSL